MNGPFKEDIWKGKIKLTRRHRNFRLAGTMVRRRKEFERSPSGNESEWSQNLLGKLCNVHFRILDQLL